MSEQMTQTPDQQALARTMATIDRLGLNDNLIELDTQGYTIIRGVLSEDQVEHAKEAILNRVEKRIGKRVDPDTTTVEDFQSPMGTSLDLIGYLLYDDEVFEQILMAEKPLALISYLIGESCLISSISCFFQGSGPDGNASVARRYSGTPAVSRVGTNSQRQLRTHPIQPRSGCDRDSAG